MAVFGYSGASTRWRWLIGLALLLLLLGVVQLSIGWGELLAPWREIPLAAIAPAALMLVLSYLLRAARIYDYCHERVRPHFTGVLRLSLLHNLGINLLPMRLGETLFPLLMRRYFGEDLVAGGSKLAGLRLFDLHVVGLAALLLVPHGLWLPLLILAWVAPLAVAPWLRRVLLGWLSTRPGKLYRVAHTAVSQMPARGWDIARLWLWTFAAWAVKLVALTLVLQLFLDVALPGAWLGVLTAELASILPLQGVAGAGTYEAALSVPLLAAGYGAEAVLRGAVNVHLFLLGGTLLLGVVALLLPAPRAALAAGATAE